MGLDRREFIKAASAALMGMQWGRPVFAAGQGGTTSTKVALPASSTAGFAGLVAAFENPDDASKAGGYWWWFNTLMDKAGITRDMNEFKAKGIGEVLLVNSAEGLGSLPMPSGPQMLSDEWMELFRFALEEAQRVGVKVGFNLCAGWCMGGPWIEPRESGRWFLQSKKPVTGPMKFEEKLPLPGNRDGYNDVRNPPNVQDYIDLPLEKLDYRDTAVTAIRLPGGEGAVIKGNRKELLPAKSNRMDASNWTLAEVIVEKPLRPFPAEPNDKPVPTSDVVDLTDKMAPDGTLTWDVPEGDWMIIRTGHRMTGSKVFLGLPGADGLSVDWLNRSGMDKQFEVMGKKLLSVAAPYVGNTLIYFADDSFEDGFPNWTENILEQFEKYRGYSAVPYLPVLAGYLVESSEVSDRFLYDYRRTVADLLADEHYARFQELCRSVGLKVQNESAGPSRSGTMCMDALKNLGRSDLPMGEYWLGRVYGKPEEEDPSLGYGQTRLEGGQNKVTKMVASGAHIYGKNLVGAESFTTTSRMHWIESPAKLRYAADRAFCEGVNRVMIHTMTGTRPQDGKPGYEYGAGTHFNPNVTWWDQSGPFLTYLARCQVLLRHGHFVADVLYYNGDWAPNIVPAKHVDPGLGKGYDYDVCNEEVLLTRLEVKDGRLVLPDGMSYRVLVLPETEKMPVRVAEKIAQLVKAGATIIGPRPKQEPGLKGYPQNDDAVNRISSEIWGEPGKITPGKVVTGKTPREVLETAGLAPDFDVDDDSAFIDFIHRASDDADIYMLLNRNKHSETLKAKFRVDPRRKAYLLDSTNGSAKAMKIAKGSKPGTAELALEIGARESYFIVFAKTGETLPNAGEPEKKPFPAFKLVDTFHGPWTVAFDTTWGGPESIELPGLMDWAQHADERVRYFSGTATYKKTFDLPEGVSPNVLHLNLGEVKEIARVRLNGQDLGVVWTDPWQVDISSAVKPTGNELEIEVTNNWPNRLIGDAKLPEEKRLTKTNIEFKGDEPLQVSGLLGPVTLQQRD